MPLSFKAFSAFYLSFEIEEASFSLPEPNRFIRNVGSSWLKKPELSSIHFSLYI
jgi:hypothetical protein